MPAPSPYFTYLTELLKSMLEKGASDLFITVGSPPALKVNGELVPFNAKPISREQAEEVIRSAMNEKQQAEFRDSRECNFAISLDGVGRFRVNTYVQRGSPGLVARHINTNVPTLESLGLPPILGQLVLEKRGLILMVGATGSGKSTSLAALVNHRNEHSRGLIITIEDPIEFMHPHKKSLIMQREVGVDTDSWFAALKNTLRQAPDVILIGEIRDRETMEYAITFAETGHLCLATLHSNNSNQALDRIINFFTIDRRPQLLMDLSLNLRGIVSQRLIPNVEGGRAPAIEIMLSSPLVSDLIHKGEVHEIKAIMGKSRDLGMCTFDQALFDLVAQGRIAGETALRFADSQNELRLMLKTLVRRPASGEDDAAADPNGLSIV
jgi:twitching motility protein PilU